MQQYRTWFFAFACLVLAFAVGATWSRVGAGQSSESRAADSDERESARTKNAVDIIEIMNLHNEYTHALDSGRLDDVANMHTETGGYGFYYQDPVTTRLFLTGVPVDLQGQPLKDFPVRDRPGCLMFGRDNIVNFLSQGGDSVRPHVEGWPGGIGKFPGKAVSRHIFYNNWVRVTGDTAVLHYYHDTIRLGEMTLVRTAAGWKFQYRKIIWPKPLDRPCKIADPKFPIPAPGSPGAVPDAITPL